VEWLYYILQAFNSGDLVRYQELCQVHNDALSAQPALVQNEQKLLEKINILCLMEIIFRYIFIEHIVEIIIFGNDVETVCFISNSIGGGYLQPAFGRSNYSLECYCRANKTFYRECGASPYEEPICKFNLKFSNIFFLYNHTK